MKPSVSSAVVLIALLLSASATASSYSKSSSWHGTSRTAQKSGPFSIFRGYRVPADGILLKDLNTGRILYAHEAERRLSPASLTKIMTALVTFEHSNLDEHVVISREAAMAHKIRLRLRTGQAFRLDDLVKAMLITSANDACLAIAQHVGGTEAGFVRLMNEKARA
ncbi:MAG TPA: serine hydrolase, partial [Nitrospirales bacterium]|nr:serine hydrolase [Nitrospirales bacterium]